MFQRTTCDERRSINSYYGRDDIGQEKDWENERKQMWVKCLRPFWAREQLHGACDYNDAVDMSGGTASAENGWQRQT